MAGNLYLTLTELVAFGLEDATDPALIRVASDLVDAFCQRPSLLVTQYTERNRLPRPVPVTRVTFTPLAIPEGAQSQFSLVRVRQGIPRGPEAETLASLLAPFGGPPAWVELDHNRIDFRAETGEVWLPATLFGDRYTEVELTYTAGYTSVPEAVKLACVQLIRNLESHPAANVKTALLDRLQLEYFAGSLLDDDVRRLLAPFAALRLN
ncbi:MAG: hypothetical protein K6U02_01170 [Firmicutes bacterium]|nr:hypothetical protein [Bacillota bacterium]